ncbi:MULTISPECIES: hypothetical protein [unclassified Rickettsia]
MPAWIGFLRSFPPRQGVVAWLIIYRINYGYYKYGVIPWLDPLLYER